MMMQLFQKSFSKDNWPAVAFTSDETSALHLVTNAVNVYDPQNFSQGECFGMETLSPLSLPIVLSATRILRRCLFVAAGVVKKLAVKGLAGFAVSPNTSSPLVAAYVPEGKGAPGFVGIWALEKLSKGDSPAPLARRSFFRVRNTEL